MVVALPLVSGPPEAGAEGPGAGDRTGAIQKDAGAAGPLS